MQHLIGGRKPMGEGEGDIGQFTMGAIGESTRRDELARLLDDQCVSLFRTCELEQLVTAFCKVDTISE